MPVLDALRTETPRPRIVREHRHARRLALTTVCAGAFLGQFDVGIVVFSLPALQRHFGTSLATAQWMSLGYLLTVAAAVIPASRLADVVGHKLIWTYGFVVVTAASAVCGLAPSLGVLIAFRVVQAVGATMIQAGGAALLSVGGPQQRPRAAMGVLGAAQILGLTAGPAAGGLLLASAGWRWVFLVSVPAGCVCVVAARYLLPRTRSTARARASIASSRAVAGQFALFAPLVLFPQLCTADGVRPAIGGMITAALPAGFALAALPTPVHRLLSHIGDRIRGVAGVTGCLAATAGIAVDPVPGAANAVLLAVLGMGLGTLVITPNASAPLTEGRPRSGGVLGVANRELGTALSVAAVTLCLHLTRSPASGPAGARLALAVLGLAVLLLGALIAARLVPVRRPRKPSVQITAPENPPDARFLLANERTFLAWNRTALALVAAGLATVQLLHPFPGVPWGRLLLAVPLILLGAVIASIGYLELRRNQRALRRAEPLPQSVLPKVLALAVTMIAIASAAVLIISAACGR